MKTYRVTVTATSWEEIEVEADNREDAIDEALNLADLCVTIDWVVKGVQEVDE